MNQFRASARTALAIALGVTLTVAGCGSGDDTSGGATVDDAPPVTTTADQALMSPSAITVDDQEGDGASIVVAEVALPAAGFVAVHGDGGGSPGPVIGVSDLLPEGTTNDVVVTLDEPLAADAAVYPMVHIDTDGNGIYEFGSVDGVDGPGVTAEGDVAVVSADIGVAASDPADDVDGGSDDTTSGDAAGENTITIADFSFGGATEVPVGTTVVVTNTDASPHTWTADDGAFDSGALAQGDTFEFTFTEAGEFAYHCNFHPSMTGTIVVTG